MQITDEGIILKKKKYRESSLIITFFSLNHGINSGLVKGVLKKDYGTYEIGNNVYIKSTFRLQDQLWNCKLELIKNNSISFFDDQFRLNALLSICSLIDLSFLKNEQQKDFYKKSINFLNNLVMKDWIKEYINWELLLLSEIGYGLDLSKCTVSGETKDLLYVSPKSGKAVSKKVGENYKNKLLNLPKFLIDKNINPEEDSLKKGIILTGYFLNKFLKNNNKKMPFYRKNIIS